MSEFGSGVVVCLVKLSEHMGDSYTQHIERAIKWQKAAPIEREKMLRDDDPGWQRVLKLDAAAPSTEKMLNDMIRRWCHAAGDHVVELDRQKAPDSLSKLADLLWELRYDARDESEWVGEEEWLQILALWSEAAMDIDERLGVRPDWGTW